MSEICADRSDWYVKIITISVRNIMESEKKLIEQKTAKLFLSLYNRDYGTQFEISELGETPDVTCIDSESGDFLYLEISLLEDLHGDVAYALGRGKKPHSQTTKTTVVDFFNDVVPLLRNRLERKLLSSYSGNTALVLRQVSCLWEPRDWECITPALRNEILKGKENNYGAGVWIICTDNTTLPVSDALFCISLPTSS